MQPTTTVEHSLCPGQNSDKECDSQLGAEDQRAEVSSQCEAQQHLEQTLGNLFPMKRIREALKNRSYCCSALPDLGLDTRRIKDLLGDLWPSDEAASPPSQAHCDVMAIPSEFSLSHGRGPKLKHTEDFGTAASSQAMLSLAVPCEVLWPTGPALLSKCPEHLQSVEGWWRTSHQEHGKWGGGSSWLSAKPRHSAFSFLVSALCCKVSTYALVSMATAFLAFFSSIKFFIWFPFFPRHDSLFLL